MTSLYLQRKQELGAEPDTPLLSDYALRKRYLGEQETAQAATALTIGVQGEQPTAEDEALAQDYQTLINPAYKPGADFVARNRERFQREVEQQRLKTMLGNSPAFRQWLVDNERSRQIGLENASVLTALESAFLRVTVDRPSIMYNQFKAERFNKIVGWQHEDGTDKTFSEIYEDNSESWHGQFTAWATTRDAVSERRYRRDTLGIPLDEDIASRNAFQKRVGELGKRMAARPTSPGEKKVIKAFGGDDWKETFVNFGNLMAEDPVAFISGGAIMLSEAIPVIAIAGAAAAITKNPAVLPVILGSTSYTHNRYLEPLQFFSERGYDFTKEEDVRRAFADPELMKEAQTRGVLRGLTIGMFDAISGGVAGKTLSQSPVFNAMFQSIIQAGAGGGGEATAQAMVGDEIRAGEVLLELLLGGALTPFDIAAARLSIRKNDSLDAGRKAKILKLVSKVAAEIELRKTSPSLFRSFVDHLTDGTPRENLFVPADEFLTFFQDKTPEELGEILPGVDPSQIERARITGEDIIVPTSTYMEKIAGTEYDEFFQDNSKFDPEGMTQSEANEFAKTEAVEITQVVALQEAERAALSAEQEVLAGVHDEITKGLEAAGQPAKIAGQQAELYTSFYKALAERTGIPVKDLVEIYKPPVIQEGEPSETVGGTEFKQSERGVPADEESLALTRLIEDSKDLEARETARAEAELKAKVNSPEFKEWFKDSVVEKGGEPLIVYHGSPTESFDTFNTEGQGKTDGTGAFFSTSENIASTYGQTNTYPVYLSMQNPMVVDAQGANWNTINGENNSTATDDLARQAREEGHDGLIIYDVKDHGPHAGNKFFVTNEDKISDIYVAFEPTQIKSASDNSGAFDPNDPNIYKQSERGRIRIPKDGIRSGQAVIDLFQSADLSTFLHESGHFFLTVLEDAALQDGAPVEVTKMAETIKAWHSDNAAAVARDSAKGVGKQAVLKYINEGTTGDKAKDAAIETGLQEQFARAFETYLMEGKAPSPELRSTFEAFRSWLVSIYKNVRNLKVKVSDDLRQVFDMMLATDEEIARAKEDNLNEMIAGSAIEWGIPQEDFDKLLDLHQAAEDEAAGKTGVAAMVPVRKARDKEFAPLRKEIRERVTPEVEAEINANPVYRVIEWFGNARWLGGEQTDIPSGVRLNKEQLVERYGKEFPGKLPFGKQRVYETGGMDIDEAASMFGFTSGDEMVTAMIDAPKRTAVIKEEVTNRVNAELAKTDVNEYAFTAAQQATNDLHSNKRGDYLAAELRTMLKIMGQGLGVKMPTMAQMREVARQTFAGMKVRDAVASKRYLAAERRAGLKAQQAFKAGRIAEAVQFKQRQLMNFLMYQQSMKAASDVARFEKLTKNLKKKNIRKKLAVDYLGAIDDILRQYELRKVSKKKDVKRTKVLAWVEKMKAEGRENEINIAPHVLAATQREPYMTLTLEHLRGVYDSLKNIEHTARRKQNLIDAQGKRDMAEIAQTVESSFAQNVKARIQSRVKTAGEKLRDVTNGYLNLVKNADTILREADGFPEYDGPLLTQIKRPIDEAEGRASDRLIKAAKDFKELLKNYTALELDAMGVRKHYPELGDSFSKFDLISIVLNMGNAENLHRLTNTKADRQFTPAQLEFVLTKLDKRDMDYVQSVLDYINSYWPEIAAREKRVKGVIPKKVEAIPIVTPHGTYPGGYFPIKYDPRFEGGRDESTDDIMNNMQAGLYAKAQTAAGHLEARSKSVKGSLLLDPNIASSHVKRVIHDLEFSEVVTNTSRILNNPAVKKSFYDKGWQAEHETLDLWLKDVATGRVAASNGFDKGVMFFRSNYVFSRLAYNVGTVLIQPLGALTSAVAIGKKNMAIGYGIYIANPAAAKASTEAKSTLMENRREQIDESLLQSQTLLGGNKYVRMISRLWNDTVTEYGFYMLKNIQYYSVDIPTWIGKYQAAIRDGLSEADAVYAADRAVERSQGSSAFPSLSAFERGTLSATQRQGSFIKLFTVFGSAMFAMGRMFYEHTKKTNFKNPAEAMNYAFNIFLLYTVQSVAYQAIRGGLPDEDDDEGRAEFSAKQTGLMIMSTFPVARDVSSALDGFDAGGGYGSIFGSMSRFLIQFGQGEVDEAARKAFLNALGLGISFPSSQTNKMIDAGMKDGATPMEYMMGPQR